MLDLFGKGCRSVCEMMHLWSHALETPQGMFFHKIKKHNKTISPKNSSQASVSWFCRVLIPRFFVADWHGALWHCCWDPGLHLSWGAEVSGRRWLLWERMWLVVCGRLYLRDACWSVNRSVFQKIPLNNIILLLRCTGLIEPSSRSFHDFCNCDQVTHHSTPTLWWEPTVRSWTIKTPSTSQTMLRSPKMPKTSSVPSSSTGRKRELSLHNTTYWGCWTAHYM